MAGQQGTIYVLTLDAVQYCVDALQQRRIHPWFAAYLHLRQQSARQGTQTEIAPDWNELGAYLEVPGGPYGQPYFRPFWNGPANAGQNWLNPNLAGSYAPSSLRAVPKRVIDVVGQRFVLRDRHWELARTFLTDDKQVPLLALAVFFLRDFGFRSQEVPEPKDVSRLFLDDFGYQLPNDEEEVAHLYDLTWKGADGSWFEVFEVSEYE